MQKNNQMTNLINILKNRGFIFPGSQIYGGLANTWDYGPLGVELKNNIKSNWWNNFVKSQEEILGLDSSILLHPKVWQASGHLNSFTDPLIDCKNCKMRFRADNLITEQIKSILKSENQILKENSNKKNENSIKNCQIIQEKNQNNSKTNNKLNILSKFKINHQNPNIAQLKEKELNLIIKMLKIPCPQCKEKDKFTEIRQFNLLFETYQGVIKDKKTKLYLRPETAQGIFINFKNVQRTMRKKLPFGIAQIGKSFRNEITPGNFIFRTREFEQMEIEYFIKPNSQSKYFQKLVDDSLNWFEKLGINKNKLRLQEHSKEELSHYSNKTVDIEYKFPFGWGEIQGIASRTDFDLTEHENHSNENLKYQDPHTKEKYFPYVIEPSFGLDRIFLAIITDAFQEEKLEKSSRSILKINPKLAPIQIAILPLKKNNEEIVKKSRYIFNLLKEKYSVTYDDSASIGKLYRRQDEIGTPFCLTVDFDTININNKVTIRNRDSMKQSKIEINNLLEYFNKLL